MIQKETDPRSSGRGALWLWRFEGFELDEARWELRRQDQRVEIETRPLELLQLLLQYAGEVIPRADLLDALWGRSEHLSDNVLTNAVGKLRRALGDDDGLLIVTVHRQGYRFAGVVRRTPLEKPQLSALPVGEGDEVPRRPGWLLKSRLGQGDSEVWLAEQKSTHALRVFKFSADGGRLSALKREATINRLLVNSLNERPDIARVLEWDFERAPYFLECEFGGDNLITWAEKQGGLTLVPLDLRLELLALIAETVASAHRLGVLHKDLKPANVLLYRNDLGLWRTRLTDFGSSRLLEPERLEALGITRLGFTLTQALDSGSNSGTPLYLAPELMTGQMPTVQADVYSLGVMLYQLAIGDLRRPLSPGWEAEVSDELLREDIAAAAHGDVVLRLKTATELAERLRNLDARRMQRRLQYQNAAELQRLQAQNERARARRPWIVAAITALSVGLGISLWFYRQADQNYQLSQSLNSFLVEDFLYAANPYLRGEANPGFLDVLADAERQIDTRFSGQPLAAAEIRHLLANAYNHLDDDEHAAKLFEQAIPALERYAGPEHSSTLNAIASYSGILMSEGRSEEAARWIERLLAAKRVSPADRADALRRKGYLLLQRDEVAAALAAFEEAMNLVDDVSEAHTPVVGAYVRSGKFQQAERLAERIERQATAANGADHAFTLTQRFDLLRHRLLYLKVEQLHSSAESLAPLIEEKLGADHPYRLYAWTELGRIRAALGDRDGASEAWQRALSLPDGAEDHLSNPEAENYLLLARQCLQLAPAAPLGNCGITAPIDPAQSSS